MKVVENTSIFSDYRLYNHQSRNFLCPCRKGIINIHFLDQLAPINVTAREWAQGGGQGARYRLKVGYLGLLDGI